MSVISLHALKSIFTVSDEQAMGRVRNHEDSSAFAQLVRRWEQPVQNLCARMTGDPHLAEDLTQDVFAKVFAQRRNYEPQAKFSTWLWRIALNRCYDELRRTQRRGECSLEPEESETGAIGDWQISPQPAPDGAADASERAEIVRRAVLRLPTAYRSVVVLRHYEDLKFREIADVLSIPEGTVKSRMAEAMTQLGQLLRPALTDQTEMGKARPTQTKPSESLIL